MRSVDVLLSFYHGDRYIVEQMASIAAQQGVRIRVLVRNDGARCSALDSALALIAKTCDVTLLEGSNLGYTRSFLTLLREASSDADYIAFADQDDVWRPDKLLRSIQALEAFRGLNGPLSTGNSQGLLYCCSGTVTDAALRPLRRMRLPPPGDLPSAISENAYPGMTMVFNQALRMRCIGIDENRVLSHDWLVLLVATAIGHVIVDDAHDGVLYRQHAANQLGNPGPTRLLANRLRRLAQQKRGKARVSDQADALLSLLGASLDPVARSAIERFVNARHRPVKRVSMAATGPYRRRDPLDSLLFRCQIAAGIY